MLKGLYFSLNGKVKLQMCRCANAPMSSAPLRTGSAEESASIPSLALNKRQIRVIQIFTKDVISSPKPPPKKAVATMPQ